MPETKDLAYYMGLPYTYILLPDHEAGGYVIEVKGLPGCISQGDTADEATTRIREAMEVWIESHLEDGRPIPEPNQDEAADAYSGKFVVRVPKSLHRALAEAAEREGVSLNLLATTALAKEVGQTAPARAKVKVAVTTPEAPSAPKPPAKPKTPASGQYNNILRATQRK